MLDLGCGYGWHCKYAAEQGAAEVLGIDLSHRMIAEAEQRNADSRITYRVCGIEDYEYPADRWDCVSLRVGAKWEAEATRNVGLQPARIYPFPRRNSKRAASRRHG